jgi:hypothetical protein
MTGAHAIVVPWPPMRDTEPSKGATPLDSPRSATQPLATTFEGREKPGSKPEAG